MAAIPPGRLIPAVIIIHYSSFNAAGDKSPRKRLRLFIEFLADSDSKFIIYSRNPGADLREEVEKLLSELDQKHPGLLNRIHLFSLSDHGDPANAASLKLLVKKVLALD